VEDVSCKEGGVGKSAGTALVLLMRRFSDVLRISTHPCSLAISALAVLAVHRSSTPTKVRFEIVRK
jgi:hypothetical protein